MKIRKYKDFDTLYKELIREILMNPNEMIDFNTSELGYVNNVFIACKTYNCDLDLGVFGYSKNKWGHLLKTYVDYDRLLEFYDKLHKVSGLSFTYDFKRKYINNGSCLLECVLTRRERHKTWTEAHIMYRTTELQRRFAADLCLIHHFIKELPEDICDIQRVYFYMPQCYVSGMFINGFYEYFEVPYETLDLEHKWTRTLYNTWKRSFQPDSKITTFMTQRKMQELALGLKTYPPMPCKELPGIKGFFDDYNAKQSKKEKK